MQSAPLRRTVTPAEGAAASGSPWREARKLMSLLALLQLSPLLGFTGQSSSMGRHRGKQRTSRVRESLSSLTNLRLHPPGCLGPWCPCVSSGRLQVLLVIEATEPSQIFAPFGRGQGGCLCLLDQPTSLCSFSLLLPTVQPGFLYLVLLT